MNSKASPYMWAMVRMDTSFCTRRNPSGQGRSGKVGPHTAVGSITPFGRAGGAGRVVDHGQFFRFLRAVVYILDLAVPRGAGWKTRSPAGWRFPKEPVWRRSRNNQPSDDPVERGYTLVVYVVTGFSDEKESGAEWLIMWWIVSGLNSLSDGTPQPRK